MKNNEIQNLLKLKETELANYKHIINELSKQP